MKNISFKRKMAVFSKCLKQTTSNYGPPVHYVSDLKEQLFFQMIQFAPPNTFGWIKDIKNQQITASFGIEKHLGLKAYQLDFEKSYEIIFNYYGTLVMAYENTASQLMNNHPNRKKFKSCHVVMKYLVYGKNDTLWQVQRYTRPYQFDKDWNMVSTIDTFYCFPYNKRPIIIDTQLLHSGSFVDVFIQEKNDLLKAVNWKLVKKYDFFKPIEKRVLKLHLNGHSNKEITTLLKAKPFAIAARNTDMLKKAREHFFYNFKDARELAKFYADLGLIN